MQGRNSDIFGRAHFWVFSESPILKEAQQKRLKRPAEERQMHDAMLAAIFKAVHEGNVLESCVGSYSTRTKKGKMGCDIPRFIEYRWLPVNLQDELMRAEILPTMWPRYRISRYGVLRSCPTIGYFGMWMCSEHPCFRWGRLYWCDRLQCLPTGFTPVQGHGTWWGVSWEQDYRWLVEQFTNEENHQCLNSHDFFRGDNGDFPQSERSQSHHMTSLWVDGSTSSEDAAAMEVDSQAASLPQKEGEADDQEASQEAQPAPWLERKFHLVYLPLRMSSLMSATGHPIRSEEHWTSCLSNSSRTWISSWQSGFSPLMTTQRTCSCRAQYAHKALQRTSARLSIHGLRVQPMTTGTQSLRPRSSRETDVALKLLLFARQGCLLRQWGLLPLAQPQNLQDKMPRGLLPVAPKRSRGTHRGCGKDELSSSDVLDVTVFNLGNLSTPDHPTPSWTEDVAPHREPDIAHHDACSRARLSLLVTVGP